MSTFNNEPVADSVSVAFTDDELTGTLADGRRVRPARMVSAALESDARATRQVASHRPGGRYSLARGGRGYFRAQSAGRVSGAMRDIPIFRGDRCQSSLPRLSRTTLRIDLSDPHTQTGRSQSPI